MEVYKFKNLENGDILLEKIIIDDTIANKQFNWTKMDFLKCQYV